jgi:serine/threonine-protein kinase
MEQNKHFQQQPPKPWQQPQAAPEPQKTDELELPTHNTDFDTASKEFAQTTSEHIFSTEDRERVTTSKDEIHTENYPPAFKPVEPSLQETQNLQDLLTFVNNPYANVQQRVIAIRRLALFGEQLPHWALTNALTDTEAAVRIAALKTYAELAYRFPSALVVAAFADKDWSVRATAAWALGFFSRDSQASLLRAIADDPDEHPLVRASALQSLGKLKDARSVKHMIALLSAPPPSLNVIPDDEDSDMCWHEREVAALALGTIGDKSALPALVRALEKDPSVHVRVAAANALATVTELPDEAIMSLNQVKNSKNDWIKQAAHKAIKAHKARGTYRTLRPPQKHSPN